MKHATVKFFFLILHLLLAQNLMAQDIDFAFQNEALSPDERAKILVAQMTLDEKIGQLMNATPAIPRLGVPQYDWWNEALHGVARNGKATIFPQGIGLGATFDPDLAQRMASAISTEARAKYIISQSMQNYSKYAGLTFWTPNVNIFRDPRWGRGQETYGEDPYLMSRMGVAFVHGLQGDDDTYLKTAACAKHFAVHSGPEEFRHTFIGKHDPKAGLRGGKYSMFDAGTRVPFIAYWKGKIAPKVSDALVCQIDLMASLAKLTGTVENSTDSQDILGALLGESDTAREQLIVEANMSTAFRMGDWVMIPPYKGPAVYKDVNIEVGNSEVFQLYNLKEDKGEQHNLAESNPEKLKEMIAAFTAVRGEEFSNSAKFELK